MESLLRSLFISLLVFSGNNVIAETSFMVSPVLGAASVSNINGYRNTTYVRVDGNFYLLPQLGLNLFYADYADFETSSGATPVSLSLNGYGIGVTGRWPLHPHIQPFVRIDYFAWDSKVNSRGKTVGADSGSSTGFALGILIPIKSFLGLKGEILRYVDVSDADIDQISFGATFQF